LCRHQSDRVAVAAHDAALDRDVVGEDPVAALAVELCLGVSMMCSVSAAKPMTRRGRLLASCATVARMSGFSLSASFGVAPAPFLILFDCGLAIRQSATARGEHRDVGGQRLLHRAQHVLRGW